jgi:hypothetical protein
MSDVQAKSPKTLPKATPPGKRRNKPLLSIRARLIVVALLAIRFDARVAARRGARLHQNAAPGRMLAVVGHNGQVKCGSDPAVIGLNIGDRPYFQNALQSRDFALSDYLIRRVSGVPGLMATFHRRRNVSSSLPEGCRLLAADARSHAPFSTQMHLRGALAKKLLGIFPAAPGDRRISSAAAADEGGTVLRKRCDMSCTTMRYRLTAVWDWRGISVGCTCLRLFKCSLMQST